MGVGFYNCRLCNEIECDVSGSCCSCGAYLCTPCQEAMLKKYKANVDAHEMVECDDCSEEEQQRKEAEESKRLADLVTQCVSDLKVSEEKAREIVAWAVDNV